MKYALGFLAILVLQPVVAIGADGHLPLWDAACPFPKTADLPILQGVEFHAIKPYEFDKDGYRFLHGVALAWHKGRLFASFGHNKGGENTDTEEARVRHSDDGGRTWSAVKTIDAGLEPDIGVSHGVFLSLKGQLWAFHGAYSGTMQDVHTRAYVHDEADDAWRPRRTVIGGGFWPLGEPRRMADGNWIIAGIRVGKGNPAAVAISHGDDVMKWDLVVIPQSEGIGKMWGESSVFVDGVRITNIARYGEKAMALAATSDDFGRSWTQLKLSNLPMATSKPCAGTLSTGQRYLICSTTADGGGRRSPLTIAVSRPGEKVLSKVFVIRHAEFPDGPGESHPKAALSYPCAAEHDGKLYVGYSNNGGNVDRKGTGRELWNNNSAEMAVIPLESLRFDRSTILPTGWDPVRAADKVMERLIRVTAPQVKGAHDAEMVLLGDRAYVVAEVNDVRPGEGAGWPEIYSAMSIVNLRTLAVEQVIPFARGKQVFENATLPECSCFVPRIIQKDAGTLRCYFAAEHPGKGQSQTWFLDYDIANGRFETRLHKAKLKTPSGTFDMQPQHFHADAAAIGFTRPPVDYGLYLFDSFKHFDGKTYVAINNYPGGQNALARVHDDLATFEIMGHYNQPHDLKLTESSANRLPDGTWMAICRQEGGNRNYLFSTSRDCKTWKCGEHRAFVPDGTSSKPTFDRFGGVYYLGWQESTRINGVNRSVFNVEVSRDAKTWERKYRFETTKSFQYPTFHEHQGAIWLCVTQGDQDASRKERIMFGKLEDMDQKP